MDAIFHRTSIRQFEDKPIESEKIEKLLRAGMQAPTAGNQMNWQFYVVRNKETIQKLSKASPYAVTAAKAPLIMVITYCDGGMFPELNDIDCAIATENIWLEADALGLGAVMMAIAPFEDRMKAVKEILNLPKEEHAFMIMPIGYPVKVKPQVDRYNENKVHFVD